MSKIINRYTQIVIAESSSLSLSALCQQNRADLSGADLSRADLSRADLSEADLSEADLSEANLSGADLSRADLSRADLSEADLSRADLSRADLSGARYNGVDLLLKYFTIGPIGSRSDYLQIFITDKQTILKTGCFVGSIEDLQTSTNRIDYQAAINFIQQIEGEVRFNG